LGCKADLEKKQVVTARSFNNLRTISPSNHLCTVVLRERGQNAVCVRWSSNAACRWYTISLFAL